MLLREKRRTSCERVRKGHTRMEKVLWRFGDLKSRGIVNNWPTLYRWIEQQGFPPGRLIGPNSRAWNPQDVLSWIEAQPVPEKRLRPTRPHRPTTDEARAITSGA